MKQVYYITREVTKNEHVAQRLKDELARFGDTYEYTDTLWILTSAISLEKLHEQVEPFLTNGDKVFTMQN